MKITIDIPKEFERHFNEDRFEDSLKRLKADAGECLAGLYEIELCKEILENLKMDCDAVLANPDLARQLIPTSRGFFFGSVEYDEGYFDDIRFTAEELQDVLENTDFVNNEVFYLEWY